MVTNVAWGKKHVVQYTSDMNGSECIQLTFWAVEPGDVYAAGE
jgi:hypothetical protein